MTDEQREAIEPATVTVGRAQRFYEILQDLDFDDAIDEAREQHEEEVTGRPVGIAEQAAHDQGQSIQDDSDGESAAEEGEDQPPVGGRWSIRPAWRVQPRVGGRIGPGAGQEASAISSPSSASPGGP